MIAAGWRRHWTLRRRIAQVFAGLAVVVGGLVVVVVLATISFVSATNTVVNRWQPAVATTQRLITDLVDQETGVRGYALADEPSFLQPYEQYSAAQLTDTARLRGLVGNDAVLRRLLDLAQAAANRWHGEIAMPAIQAVAAGDPAGAQLVESPRAKQLFDDFRNRAATLAAGVTARTRDARSARTTAGVIFVVAVSITSLLLIAAAIFLWRGLHRWVLSPVDRLAAQTREVASGDTFRQIVGGGPAELTALGRDVEAMRLQIAGQLARAEETQEELRRGAEELARSNDDLQQFAYVASHDLSEPLRKVANFCQLLERQYGSELDDRAREYIGFAVDGAKRMQVLITDLLSLSRVGRNTEQFVPVDLNAALDAAVANLGDRFTAAGARLDRLTPLPTVPGDRSLLTSLLENLVGNAVKYHREGVAPIIRIAAGYTPGSRQWTFTVSDNGIGIDAEYAERIFVVFQRLHLRDRYGGTGIGLALCRKIVEFHGGRIWLAPVESTPGATFRFTLPEGVLSAEPRH